MSFVIGGGNTHPSLSDGAGTEGAIVASPCSVGVIAGSKEGVEKFLAASGAQGVVILLRVANALVVGSAGTVPAAAIGAVRVGDAHEGHEDHGGANHVAVFWYLVNVTVMVC